MRKGALCRVVHEDVHLPSILLGGVFRIELYGPSEVQIRPVDEATKAMTKQAYDHSSSLFYTRRLFDKCFVELACPLGRS